VTVDEQVYSKILQAEQKLITDAVVYPNPADKQVNIKWTGTPGASYVISITGLDGKQLLRQTTKSDFLVLPVREWPAGTYLIQVKEANRTILNRQLVVRH
jgi:hypothetical protein